MQQPNAPASPQRQNLVRALREERLMSREELAKRARVSLRTIWSVEAGHDCRLETKRSILRALRISRSQHRIVFPSSTRDVELASPPDAPRVFEGPEGEPV